MDGMFDANWKDEVENSVSDYSSFVRGSCECPSRKKRRRVKFAKCVRSYREEDCGILLEGEKSDAFDVDQGVAQGCSLSPILLSLFINDLLKGVKQQVPTWVHLSSGKRVGGMVFTDDFEGIDDGRACRSL